MCWKKKTSNIQNFVLLAVQVSANGYWRTTYARVKTQSPCCSEPQERKTAEQEEALTKEAMSIQNCPLAALTVAPEVSLLLSSQTHLPFVRAILFLRREGTWQICMHKMFVVQLFQGGENGTIRHRYIHLWVVTGWSSEVSITKTILTWKNRYRAK